MVNKITQYADDKTLTIDGSQESLFNSVVTLDFFSKLSGLKINSPKTKMVWIGSRMY